MEFGVVGFDGLVSSGNGFPSLSSDHATKQKSFGSSGFSDDCDLRASKIAKLSDDLSLKHSSFVFSDAQHEQSMLSFSSPKLGDFSPKSSGGLENKYLQSSPFSYFQHPSSFYSKNAGYLSTGGLNSSMYFLNGVKGPFTPSQWFELEQQALIYKYIISNEPVPPNLLIPIRKALESAGFSGFPGGPTTFGWGPLHLGFSSSTDPEPGRCRRTDGKKWRCSRDAVPDQKYCERHMNRGRHRSRKPVEGHSGHSVSGATTATNKTSSTDLMNMSSSSSALLVPGASNSFSITHNHSKELHPVAASSHLSSPLVNRLMVNKANSSQVMQGASGLDFLSSSSSLNSEGFAFLTSDALLNTSQRTSSLSGNYGSSHDPNSQTSNPQHSLHPFMDKWPKNASQTDQTQLSISIQPADFMSSTSSPTEERVTLSPLRLSRDLDTVQMGLGVGTFPYERSLISWESSMGGPLGEVLKTTSPQLSSSPTGVLQRTALGSLSNSSAGSSPRAEHGKALESVGLRGDYIGSPLGSSSALPTL